MDRTTPHLVPGNDRLVAVGGYLIPCACRPDDHIRCQFHTRFAERGCPDCKIGKLTRMTDGECNRVVYNKELRRRVFSKKAVWTCNVCEHCEED